MEAARAGRPASVEGLRGRLAGRGTLAMLVVFVVALAARLAVILNSVGGYRGNVGYDQSVYYAAAAALLHGRLPYRDFVLLHPPGLMLALTPFAAVGALTTDHIGFEVANLAAPAVGAVNAVLVVGLSRRIGASPTAAVVGGLFYGLWFAVVTAEGTARLEPLGNFALLCGLVLLANPDATRRRSILGGVALGFAACVKIWWALPLVLLIAAELAHRRPRRALRVASGAAAVIAAICGPFLVAAPRAMIRMVVRDQAARPPVVEQDWVTRLNRLATFDPGAMVVTDAALPVALVALVAAVAAALLLGFGAWRLRAARTIVVLAAAQFVVLLIAPTFYSYYGAYLAPALAVVVAAAATTAAAGLRSPAPRLREAVGSRVLAVVVTVVTITAAALTCSTVIARTGPISESFPGSALAARTRSVRCLVSDSPMAQIQLDLLSRGLARGCPNWIDVIGRSYDVDALRNRPDVPRSQNPRWQRDIRRYLLSGDAAMVIYPSTQLDHANRRRIQRHVLAHVGEFKVYSTGHRPRTDPTAQNLFQ